MGVPFEVNSAEPLTFSHLGLPVSADGHTATTLENRADLLQSANNGCTRSSKGDGERRRSEMCGAGSGHLLQPGGQRSFAVNSLGRGQSFTGTPCLTLCLLAKPETLRPREAKLQENTHDVKIWNSAVRVRELLGGDLRKQVRIYSETRTGIRRSSELSAASCQGDPLRFAAPLARAQSKSNDFRWAPSMGAYLP